MFEEALTANAKLLDLVRLAPERFDSARAGDAFVDFARDFLDRLLHPMADGLDARREEAHECDPHRRDA